MSDKASSSGDKGGKSESEIGDIADLDVSKICLERPTWELHKKGEIMKESAFYSKYYSFSMPTIRDSYQNALIGKIKYYDKMKRQRAKEAKIMQETGQQWPPPTTKEPGAWSDTSSHQSCFRASMVKNKTKVRSGKAAENPKITEICDRLGKLIETPAVQDVCNVKPAKGSKYRNFGGGSNYSQQFQVHSKEDPWDFPQL